MLNLITGKQRSGKSYYCVTLLIEYLQTSTRPIYTNLPLNPDKLCDFACSGKLRHPSLYQSYMSRLHMFVNFRGRKRIEYKIFKFRNPDYVQSHKKYKNLLLSDLKINNFWNYTDSNSVIMLDELYQYFNALDSNKRDETSSNLRRELLTYSRQHGHFKDDMYLISHNEKDIDVHIRRGCQSLYVVENAKYKNISEKFLLLRGFKYPFQFFIISVYAYGEVKHQDRFIRFSKKIIFDCYESFSQPETLLKKKALEFQKSTDTHIDNKKNFKNYFMQTLPFFIVIIFVVVIAVVVIQFMFSVSKTSIKIDLPEPSSVNTNNIKISDFHKVIFISSNCIIFDDKYKLKIGDKINDFEVKSFTRSYAVLSYNDKLFNVSYAGLRVRQSEDRNKDDNRFRDTTVKATSSSS